MFSYDLSTVHNEKKDTISEAIKQFVEIRQIQKPTLQDYTQVLQACGRVGDVEVAQELIKDMERNNIKLDVHCYNWLILLYRTNENMFK